MEDRYKPYSLTMHYPKTTSLCIGLLWMSLFFPNQIPGDKPPDSIGAIAQRFQGLTGTLRVVPNLCRRVYVTVGDTHYYYEHQDSRLFPSRHEIENVQIAKIAAGSPSGNPSGSNAGRLRPSNPAQDNRPYLSIVLQHPHLKRGEIRLYREDKKLADRVDDIAQILGYAIAAPGIPKQPLYIGNRQTRMLHYAGCNYLPPKEICEPFDTIEAAKEKGYRLSSLSFSPLPLLSSYEEEQLLGARTAADLRYYFSICSDDAIQKRVEDSGRRVLSKWPMSLKGYTYRFSALDSDSVNAYACPGGTVFVTTGLLETLESDEELEAVLAHEITHVEKRHGLRQLRSFQTGAIVGAILTLGAATSAYDNNDSAAIGIGMSGLIVQVASSIALTGYSREHEMESDMVATMYLLRNKMDVRLLSQALRKFKYHSDKLGLSSGRSSLFSTHPALDDRIYIAEHSQIYPFETPIVFDGFTRSEELAGSLKFEAEFVYTDESKNNTHILLAELGTTTALGKEEKIKEIRLTCSGRSLKLNNKDDSPVRPQDTISMTFEITDPKMDSLQNIQAIVFKLGPVETWTPHTE